MFSVDVAEGVTVAFDSYPKADGSRKSEYGSCVISYNDGITIDHVMASNTLPEFYNYARVPSIEQEGEDIRCMTNIKQGQEYTLLLGRRSIEQYTTKRTLGGPSAILE